MYGGRSHKYGRGSSSSSRGGSGTHSKRNSFPPPPPPHHHNNNNRHTTTTTTTSTRPSLGGGRSRTPSSTPSPAPSQSCVEESFRLVGGDEVSLALASIIRLAPELVEEIRRVESQGGVAKIKFDSHPNNNTSNVIDVGGKEFRFTWSKEMGYCDIYEERQSGEDGQGLLVETGYAWRKINIQRVLDDSISNQVKKRSQECEQNQKARKAIILEPGNPSAKSQVKALAAAEASPWKHKQKKEFQFKKKNSEPPQGPYKPDPKSVSSTTTVAKRMRSVSPCSSPQEKSGSLASPTARGIAIKSQFVVEKPTSTQTRGNQNAVSAEKDLPTGVSGRIQETAVRRDIQKGQGLELQQLLVTLLKENPKGMSLKALEKAAGDVSSGSARKIEPILKKIATYEHPGKYVLKPEVLVENLKSSPQVNLEKPFAPEDFRTGVTALDSGCTEKSPAEYMEDQVPSNNKFDRESNVIENIDTAQHFQDLFGDDEPPHHSEAQAANSSGSGSDSGSRSSDSGTDSASRSRSRSPAGSASSSDSDGGSSNSKEESDVDVDIMSDGEKDPKKLQDAGLGLSATTVPWGMHEAEIGQDGRAADHDGYASEDVDIENDFVGPNEAQLITASHDRHLASENLRTASPDHNQHQPYGVAEVVGEREDAEDDFRSEPSDSFFSSEGKSKRGSNAIQFDENAANVKRFKGSQSSVSQNVRSTLVSPPKLSPDIYKEDNHNSRNYPLSNQFNRTDNATANLGAERGYNYNVPGKSAVESLQSGRKPPTQIHNMETADRPFKNSLSVGVGANYQETNSHAREGIPKQGAKGFAEVHDEEGSSNEKGNGRIKGSSIGQKSSMQPESLPKIHSERSKKPHARYLGSTPNDNGKVDFEKSPGEKKKLHRELSDLELGELRDPLPEEPEIGKKQFERGSSFKQSNTKLGAPESRKSDSRGKPTSQPTLHTGNTSSPNARKDTRNTDASSKRKLVEPDVENANLLLKGVQSQQQPSKGVRLELGSLSNKLAELDRSDDCEAVANRGMDLEGYGETQRKPSMNGQHEISKKEHGSRKGKANKSRKSNSKGDGGSKRKDSSVTDGRKDKRKRNKSSSDDDASYSKYEKEEPELRGPISNFSVYKDYVEEYREKYDSYRSLNKILEDYRNEFQKLGTDLKGAKGKDMERYANVLAQLRESYRQCGTRHKRLKKIFTVLHEELKHLKQRIKDFAADYMRE